MSCVCNCVLIFTSMGGAIAVHVAAERLLSSLVGIVVVDVVEGITAYLNEM